MPIRLAVSAVREHVDSQVSGGGEVVGSPQSTQLESDSVLEDTIRARLTSTEPELHGYCAEEASLLHATADRPNVSEDDELQEMGLELGKAADRLRNLAGLSQEEC
jgi:hypothetical protein